MNEPASIVALIPARGGSKGLPRKNILPLAGKRVIDWSIDAGLKSKMLSDVYVSTEDTHIATCSEQRGAKIISRPDSLASDRASSEAVIEHAINELERLGVNFTHVCLLQPTSPLRTAVHIDEACKTLVENNANCVISVYKSKHTAAKAYKKCEDGSIQGLLFDDAPYMRRQDLPEAYFPNGAIYVFSKEKFLEYSRIPRTEVFPYFMSEAESIDIDTQEDLEITEKILKEEKHV